MNVKFLLSCAIAYVAIPWACADTIDQYVKSQMLRFRVPGISLAVVREGRLIKAEGYGYANLETRNGATPDSVFKIASVSKQFLAAAVMLLVQDGKLSLDDRADRYLEGLPESWKGISIRQLLSHTAGLAREPAVFTPYESLPDADILKSAYTQPLIGQPGEKWAYSNVGYYAIAEVIRRVSGMPYDEFLLQRLFVPLGMTATQPARPGTLVINRASGYRPVRGGFQNAENWLAIRPSGAFLSTVLDLAKWDAALYKDAPLTVQSKQLLWTPAVLTNGKVTTNGLGWFLDQAGQHRRVRHDGGLPGFQAAIHRYVDRKLTVIVMANSANLDINQIADRVANFYLPGVVPPAPPAIANLEPEVTAAVRRTIDGLSGGILSDADCTPELAKVLREQIASGFSERLRTEGKVKAHYLIDRKDEGETRTYRYLLEYQWSRYTVQCTLSRDGKISKFSMFD